MCNRKLRIILPIGPFYRKLRHQTSPVGLPLEGSGHAQSEVVEYPIKRQPEGVPLEGCVHGHREVGGGWGGGWGGVFSRTTASIIV